MRGLKVGDTIEQLDHVFKDDISPIAIITRIKNGTVFHKHIGKNYDDADPTTKQWGNRISLNIIKYRLITKEAGEAKNLKELIEILVEELKRREL
jgi:hypothetical protein